MKKVILMILVTCMLTSCASMNGQPVQEIDKNYLAYLEVQKAQAANWKPTVEVCRLKARPGETITLSGVEEFTCLVPAQAMNGLKQRETPVQPVHPGWRVLDTAIRVGGTILGIKVGGDVLTDFVDAIGKNAGHNISGSFNDGSTHTNVSGSFNTDQSGQTNGSFNGDNRQNVNNSNQGNTNTDRHDVTTTTTTTDNHAVNQAATPLP